MSYKTIVFMLTLFLLITKSLANSEPISTKLTETELNALLSQAEINFGRIKTVKSLFTQEKRLSIFADKVISKGFSLFKAPNNLRLEFTDPFKSCLIVSNNNVYKYEYYDELWHKLNPGNKELMLRIMRNITAWLKGDFNDPELYDISAYKKDNIALILTPKHKEFKEFITSFELGLNKSLDRLEYIIVNEQGKDYTKIVFYNDIVDHDISEELFSGSGSKPQKVEKW